MGCCPKGVFRPLVIDCTGATVTMPADGTLLTDIVGVPVVPLDQDLIIYVDPTGDDLSGNGSEAKPYATLIRALVHVNGINPGIFNIEVNVAEGAYDFSQTFRPEMAFGERVSWKGSMDTHGGSSDLAFSGFDTGFSTDGDFSNMQYFDCVITLPSGFTTAVGQFIGIDDPSAGTFPEACYGVHEVIAWSSGPREATVRIWSLLNTTELPSGSVVSSGHVFKTILNFTISDFAAIEVTGPHHGGVWSQLVVAGVGTGGWGATRAVSTDTHGQIEFAIAGIHNWLVGLNSADSGLVTAKFTYVSKSNAQLILLTSNAIGNVTSSIFTGCAAATAISVSLASILIAPSTVTVGSGRTQTFQAAIMSSIDLRSGKIFFDDGAATAVKAISGSRIVATSMAITGYSTDFDPTEAASPSADFSTIQTTP